MKIFLHVKELFCDFYRCLECERFDLESLKYMYLLELTGFTGIGNDKGVLLLNGPVAFWKLKKHPRS